MLQGDILIVGGYGAVGRTIANRLAEKFPGQVIVAGRNFEKAEALAQNSGGKIQPLQLDLNTAHENPDILDGVAAVVMCLDVPDMRFVRQALQRGIHYVDITADDEILQQIEALVGVAREGGSTVVLSVGLAPGLTNLLARYVQTQFDHVHQLDIYVLLGLGDAHGSAATRWTVQNLNADYVIRENGLPRQTGSFAEHKAVDFPDDPGKRKVYRFNLADQHVLTRTLHFPSVSTWLTFDPAATATLMAFLRRTDLSKLLRYQWIEDLAVKLSTAMQRGSDKYIAQIEAHGEIDGRIQTQTAAVSGHGQSKGTGLVAAQIVAQLLSGDFPPGVFHSEQLFEPRPFIQQLAEDGIVFHENTREAS
jgi:saccharopine dehydrogenase-like NADP-dependent oxidoreductase